MKNLIADVQAFLEAGSYPITSVPHIPNDRIRDLCKTLTMDEINELHEAIDQPDLAKILQEALDSIYVAIDVLLYHGLGDLAAEGWKQLQASNMAKVDATTGKLVLREDGKILKPEGWQPVDWKAIIAKCRDTTDVCK